MEALKTIFNLSKNEYTYYWFKWFYWEKFKKFH